jgi:uncharacterized protein DUF6526
MSEPQSFKNHGRVVPVYHIGVFFSFVANFFWSIYRIWHGGVNGDSIVALVVAVALLLMFFSVRIQILTVQDRVVRLEMRLRLARVLPADLHAQSSRLDIKQLVALRFGSDAELPALVRDAVAGRFATTKEIKMQVKDWQADYQRA